MDKNYEIINYILSFDICAVLLRQMLFRLSSIFEILNY